MSEYIVINGKNINKSVTELNLQLMESELEEIPDSIGELTNLRKLKIDTSESTIKHIPSAIGNLVNLKELSIVFNDYITTLPDSIGNLENLEVLLLRYGIQFRIVPDIINNLKLEKLIISGCIGFSMHEIRGNLSNLRELVIIGSNLQKLDPSIGELPFLRELHLEANELKSLPDSICKLKRLEILQLSNNNLVVLPDCIGDLSSLQYLNLGVNSLVKLPESIGNLTKLNKLILTKNKLTELPDSFGNLKSLTELQLRDNPTISYTTFPRGLISEQFYNLVRKDVEMDDIDKTQDIEKISESINVLHAHGANLQSKITLPDNLSVIFEVEHGQLNYGMFTYALRKLPEKTLKVLSLPQNNYKLTSYLKNMYKEYNILVQSYAPGSQIYDMIFTFNGTYKDGTIFSTGIYPFYSKYNQSNKERVFDPDKYIHDLKEPYDLSSPITQFFIDKFNIGESEINRRLVTYLASRGGLLTNNNFLTVKLSELIENNLIPPGILIISACRVVQSVFGGFVNAEKQAKEERKWFRSRIHAMHEGVLSCSGPESKLFSSPHEFCRVSGFHSCKEDGYCSTCAVDNAIVVNSMDEYTTCFTADELRTLFDKNPSQKIEGGFVRNPYFPKQTISSDYYAFANGKIPPFTKFRELLITKSEYDTKKQEFLRIVDEYIIPIKQLGEQRIIDALYKYMLGIYNGYKLENKRIGRLMQKVLTDVYNTGDYNIDYDVPKIR